jgi:hypothetical protein
MPVYEVYYGRRNTTMVNIVADEVKEETKGQVYKVTFYKEGKIVGMFANPRGWKEK